MHQLPFPLACLTQAFLYVRLPFPKLGLKQVVRHAAQRLRFRKALTAQQKQEFKLIEEKKFMKQNYFRALRQI